MLGLGRDTRGHQEHLCTEHGEAKVTMHRHDITLLDVKRFINQTQFMFLTVVNVCDVWQLAFPLVNVASHPLVLFSTWAAGGNAGGTFLRQCLWSG